MAMRPIWTGSLGFGLVNIPVKLYLAAGSADRISFHLLHKEDGGRIRYRKVCEVDGAEVAPSEIVKGYEYEKGRYVEIGEEDLDAIDIGLHRTVDIAQFVSKDELDPIWFDRPYFLEPVPGAERAYALLFRALEESGRLGIARVVFRDREHLAAVRTMGEALTLSTLRFATEVRSADALHLPGKAARDVPDKQVELALSLVDQLTAPWDPAAFEDRYEEALRRLVEKKLEGAPLPRPEAPGPPSEAGDLAEILRRSLATRPEAGERRAPERKAARTAGESPSANGTHSGSRTPRAKKKTTQGGSRPVKAKKPRA